MSKFYIVGIGPGNPLFMLPIADEILQKSDIIIGGKRSLKSINMINKKSIEIDQNLDGIVEYIKENINTSLISVVASGDPGFFSILKFLKKHFKNDEIEVIPGISSVQYMFAKIGLNWDDAYLGSLHGKDEDIIEKVKQNSKLVFLTDPNNSFKEIAIELSNNGFGERTMYVGSNLSYEDEAIVKDKAKNFINMHAGQNLSIVVIIDE